VSKKKFYERENDYGGVKLKADLDKKIIRSWILAKSGFSVDQKKGQGMKLIFAPIFVQILVTSLITFVC
jgi:hypothetical protein